MKCHNPYFSRWFSAIWRNQRDSIPNEGHNPYFSRWFSAIKHKFFNTFSACDVTILILVDGFLQYRYWRIIKRELYCHNPYFSRWFSAIIMVLLNC